MNLEFAKLHALGNDFLIARVGEAADVPDGMTRLARRLCDRRRGVGADGVIYYQLTVADPDADVSAIIVNADGSKAEVSGNGLRCLAAFLHSRSMLSGNAVRIRTVVGVKTYELREASGKAWLYRSRMGHPILDPARVPALIGRPPEPVLDQPLPLEDGAVRVTISSMGNPHCSTFWPDVDRAPIESLGPRLECHESFPRRTNVEFVQVVDRHTIRARFWERGVGRTLASGTGSCAAAVAAILLGLAESPVNVRVELGDMTVQWRPGEDLQLTGPAELVCHGVYSVGPAGSEPE